MVSGHKHCDCDRYHHSSRGGVVVVPPSYHRSTVVAKVFTDFYQLSYPLHAVICIITLLLGNGGHPSRRHRHSSPFQTCRLDWYWEAIHTSSSTTSPKFSELRSPNYSAEAVRPIRTYEAHFLEGRFPSGQKWQNLAKTRPDKMAGKSTFGRTAFQGIFRGPVAWRENTSARICRTQPSGKGGRQ